MQVADEWIWFPLYKKHSLGHWQQFIAAHSYCWVTPIGCIFKQTIAGAQQDKQVTMSTMTAV